MAAFVIFFSYKVGKDTTDIWAPIVCNWEIKFRCLIWILKVYHSLTWIDSILILWYPIHILWPIQVISSPVMSHKLKAKFIVLEIKKHHILLMLLWGLNTIASKINLYSTIPKSRGNINKKCKSYVNSVIMVLIISLKDKNKPSSGMNIVCLNSRF